MNLNVYSSYLEEDLESEKEKETGSEEKQTPGFEAILALAGLAGAMLVVNRRRD